MTTNDQELTLQITGMDCAGCARTIERGISQLKGVANCSVNFTTERLRVSGAVTDDMIRQRVDDLGFGVVDPTDVTMSTTSNTPPPTGFLPFMWKRWETRLLAKPVREGVKSSRTAANDLRRALN